MEKEWLVSGAVAKPDGSWKSKFRQRCKFCKQNHTLARQTAKGVTYRTVQLELPECTEATRDSPYKTCSACVAEATTEPERQPREVSQTL